jgi:transcriptional antiterminator RfaH
VADGSITAGVKPWPWLLLQSKPRAEALARLHLQRQGFEVFLPRIERHLPGPQGMRTRIEALFPRYMFIRGDTATAAWSAIRSTRGVSTLVRFGERLAEIPPAVMADLLRCHDATRDVIVPTAAVLRRGQRVRVNDGPLTGLAGVFLAPCGVERVRVLLQMIGLERTVELPLAALIPCN